MSKYGMMTALTAAAGTLAAWGGLLTACPPECESAETIEIKSVDAKDGTFFIHPEHAGSGEHHVAVYAVGHDDGAESHTIKIVQKDGETIVYIDGKQASSDEGAHLMNRFFNRKTGGGVNFSGDVDVNFGIAGDPDAVWVGDEPDVIQRLRLAEDAAAPDAKPLPKVMVGVIMDDVDESLAEYLGIDNGRATRITRVIEGLPASKGGLKTHDIVVMVDGHEKASPDDIRAILQKKHPGEALKLKVLRAGQPKELRLMLESYDAKALGAKDPAAAPDGGANIWRFGNEDLAFPGKGQLKLRTDGAEATYQVIVEDLMDTLEDHLGENNEVMMELELHLDDLRAQLEEQLGDYGATGGWNVVPPQWEVPVVPEELLQREYRFFRDDNENGAVIVPRAPRPGATVGGGFSGLGSNATKELEERMDKLDDRLDRLESLLERLLEQQSRSNH